LRLRAAQLIREYTREAGVRQLEREIAALSRKATRKSFPKRQGGDGQARRRKPERLLGHAPFIAETAEKITEYASPPGWRGRRLAATFCSSKRRGCGAGQFAVDRIAGEVMKEARRRGELPAQPAKLLDRI